MHEHQEFIQFDFAFALRVNEVDHIQELFLCWHVPERFHDPVKLGSFYTALSIEVKLLEDFAEFFDLFVGQLDGF